MRIILFFITFFFVSTSCFSQVLIDKRLEKRYIKTIKKSTTEYQIFFKEDNDTSKTAHELYDKKTGIGIFTIYRADTLNKEDLIHDTGKYSIKIPDYDPKTRETIAAKKRMIGENENEYCPVVVLAILKNDSVHIKFASPFYPRIETVFNRSAVSASYSDYTKYDTLFRVDLNAAKTNEIRLHMEIAGFAISSSSFKRDNTVYAEADMKTPVYYVDDSSFKNGYIKQQLHIKYLLKLKIALAEDYQ